MHMHPTVTHAAADHRRQDYLTEAAVAWSQRPEPERITIRRKTQFLWSMTAAVDCVLFWLTREFTPTSQAMDLEPHGSRPLSISGPR